MEFKAKLLNWQIYSPEPCWLSWYICPHLFHTIFFPRSTDFMANRFCLYPKLLGKFYLKQNIRCWITVIFLFKINSGPSVSIQSTITTQKDTVPQVYIQHTFTTQKITGPQVKIQHNFTTQRYTVLISHLNLEAKLQSVCLWGLSKISEGHCLKY